MSVLAEIANATTTDINCGPFWLRVLLCTLPEQLDHAHAMGLAAGAAESAAGPDVVPNQSAQANAARVRRLQPGIVNVVRSVVKAIAVPAPDGKPTGWEPLSVVATMAEEDPANGRLSAESLDRVAPGCLFLAASVAMHQLELEVGVLRPFSEITPASSE